MIFPSGGMYLLHQQYLSLSFSSHWASEWLQTALSYEPSVPHCGNPSAVVKSICYLSLKCESRWCGWRARLVILLKFRITDAAFKKWVSRQVGFSIFFTHSLPPPHPHHHHHYTSCPARPPSLLPGPASEELVPAAWQGQLRRNAESGACRLSWLAPSSATLQDSSFRTDYWLRETLCLNLKHKEAVQGSLQIDITQC